MIKLQPSVVMAMHTLMTRETGGSPGLRDEALLDSALSAAFQTFGGEALYPSMEEKCARLGHSLIANHAFADGNKRIGMLVMLTFAEINGIPLRPAVDEVTHVGLAVAAGEMGYEELLAWIRAVLA